MSVAQNEPVLLDVPRNVVETLLKEIDGIKDPLKSEE
jgi:hypothetical protein